MVGAADNALNREVSVLYLECVWNEIPLRLPFMIEVRVCVCVRVCMLCVCVCVVVTVTN